MVTTLREFPFRIPPNVMLLLRVGTVAEGVCRQLDPEFAFVAFVRSFLIEQGLFEREIQAMADELTADLRTSVPALPRLPAKADRLLDRLERGELDVRAELVDQPDLRVLGYAVLARGLFVATALLTFHDRPYEFVGLALGLLFLLLFWRGSR